MKDENKRGRVGGLSAITDGLGDAAGEIGSGLVEDRGPSVKSGK
jgi:hypothetical protein